jgi:glycosyltransferase involved in cell wall biosynthesis
VRILFSLLDAGLGGGQQVAAWLAEAAVGRGHAVGLLVPEPGPTQARFAALRAQTHLARLLRLRDPRDVSDAARVLRDYDVLWSHTAIGGQLLGDLAARWARRPHVIHQHTYPQFASREPEATMQRLLARTFLDQRRFIAVAPHVRDGLVASGIRPDRIEVVPNGVPLAPAAPPRGGSPIRVGLLGRFDPGKGMLEFVEGVRTAGLTPEQATFTIGGSSGPFASYEAVARDRAAEAGIAIEEPGTDGTGFLARQDVVVVPSRYEGSPLALLEAMALGKAIVASDIPGVTSITGPDGPAVLVPLADTIALADALRDLVHDPSRQLALGRAARELVADRFKLETMTDRALDFLEHAVQAAAI